METFGILENWPVTEESWLLRRGGTRGSTVPLTLLLAKKKRDSKTSEVQVCTRINEEPVNVSMIEEERKE